MDLIAVTIIMIIVITVAIILLSKVLPSNRKRTTLFKDFASRNGFKYTTKKELYFVLNQSEGTIDGVNFLLFEKIEGVQTARRVMTCVNVYPVPFDFNFKIKPMNRLLKFKNNILKNRIVTGNEALDHQFLFTSDSPDAFRKLMIDNHLQSELLGINKDTKGSIMLKMVF